MGKGEQTDIRFKRVPRVTILIHWRPTLRMRLIVSIRKISEPWVLVILKVLPTLRLAHLNMENASFLRNIDSEADEGI